MLAPQRETRLRSARESAQEDGGGGGGGGGQKLTNYANSPRLMLQFDFSRGVQFLLEHRWNTTEKLALLSKNHITEAASTSQQEREVEETENMREVQLSAFLCPVSVNNVCSRIRCIRYEYENEIRLMFVAHEKRRERRNITSSFD